MTQIDERTGRLVEELASRIDQIAEGVHQTIMEVVDTPSVFTITPIDTGRFDPRNIWSKPVRITLWCTHPGEYHPVFEASYETSLPKEWFVEALPYLRATLKILRVTPIVRAPLAGCDVNEIASTLQILETICKATEEEMGLTDAVDVPEEDRLLYSDRYEVERPADRAVKKLLQKLDQTNSFKPLRKTRTPRGRIAWVCPAHAEMHYSQRVHSPNEETTRPHRPTVCDETTNTPRIDLADQPGTAPDGSPDSTAIAAVPKTRSTPPPPNTSFANVRDGRRVSTDGQSPSVDVPPQPPPAIMFSAFEAFLAYDRIAGPPPIDILSKLSSETSASETPLSYDQIIAQKETVKPPQEASVTPPRQPWWDSDARLHIPVDAVIEIPDSYYEDHSRRPTEAELTRFRERFERDERGTSGNLSWSVRVVLAALVLLCFVAVASVLKSESQRCPPGSHYLPTAKDCALDW